MFFQRYRATHELGKGSFGTVYLAEGRLDKKPYVVKVSAKCKTRQPQIFWPVAIQVVDNLRENNLKVQEIRIMLHLKHRNIIEMRDFYTSNNQLCIVMDFADGGDLRGEIVKARHEKANISEELMRAWMIQVTFQPWFDLIDWRFNDRTFRFVWRWIICMECSWFTGTSNLRMFFLCRIDGVCA